MFEINVCDGSAGVAEKKHIAHVHALCIYDACTQPSKYMRESSVVDACTPPSPPLALRAQIYTTMRTMKCNISIKNIEQEIKAKYKKKRNAVHGVEAESIYNERTMSLRLRAIACSKNIFLIRFPFFFFWCVPFAMVFRKRLDVQYLLLIIKLVLCSVDFTSNVPYGS